MISSTGHNPGGSREISDDAALIAETLDVFKEDSWSAFDPTDPYPGGAGWHRELVERIGAERASRIWQAAIDRRWGPSEERRRRLDEELGR